VAPVSAKESPGQPAATHASRVPDTDPQDVPSPRECLAGRTDERSVTSLVWEVYVRTCDYGDVVRAHPLGAVGVELDDEWDGFWIDACAANNNERAPRYERPACTAAQAPTAGRLATASGRVSHPGRRC
jgi:hypothetical protein